MEQTKGHSLCSRGRPCSSEPKGKKNEWNQTDRLRWSDLDPVGHLKHSVYYDLAASQRIGLLPEVGLASRSWQPWALARSSSRRSALFGGRSAHRTKRYHSQLIGLSDDQSVCLRHEFFKGEVFCARLEVSCMDRSEQEKADRPPEKYRAAFDQIPRSDDFSSQTDIEP